MYVPRAFAESELGALDGLLRRDPFVTLVTLDAQGLPFASHLPALHSVRDGRVVLEGHWARANPQSSHDGAALVIVHGPHAYVSPAWYPDKEPAARVPTWNYAVAHLRGPLERYDDSVRLAALVDRLSRRFEPTVGQDWRFDAGREDLVRQLRGIVGFRFEAAQVDLKFKLSQNHPVPNVAAVADALDALDAPAPREIADLMRARLARRTES